MSCDWAWQSGWLVVFYIPSTARSFREGTPCTVPCEGREARFLHCTPWESNPRPSRGSPLLYTTAAPRQLPAWHSSIAALQIWLQILKAILNPTNQSITTIKHWDWFAQPGDTYACHTPSDAIELNRNELHKTKVACNRHSTPGDSSAMITNYQLLKMLHLVYYSKLF